MLVNPGGPGGSGLDLSRPRPVRAERRRRRLRLDRLRPARRRLQRARADLRPELLRRSAGRDYVPPTPAARDDLAGPVQGATPTACGKNGGALLDHMKTTDSANDMDSIRTALAPEADQLLRLLVRHLPRPGLRDAVPEPGAPHGARRQRRPAQRSGTRPTSTRTSRFERNIKIWFGWLAKYDSVYHLGKTAAAGRGALLRGAGQAAAPTPAGGVVGPRRVDRHLPATPATTSSTWLDLGDAFAGWVNDHDDADADRRAYEDADGVGDDNGFAMYARSSAPTRSGRRAGAKWQPGQLDRVRQTAPFETWANAWFNAPCLYWPAKARKPVKVDGTQGPERAAGRRDARRGHAVRGQPRGAQAASRTPACSR